MAAVGGGARGDPPAADPPAADPAAEAPVVEAPVAGPGRSDRPVVTGRPVAARAGTPAVARPVERRTGSPATTGPAVERSATTRPADPERSTAARPSGDRASTDPADDTGGRPPRTALPRRRPAGAGGDHVRAVREVAREPAGPAVPATPPSEEPAPGATRPGPDDGPPPVGRLHDVLLGLAGRLDDDALTSVREMVAAEADAEAAELLGGCLLAGGIGLTGGERAVLRPWFTAARVDPELLGLLPADSGALDSSVHRFVTNAAGRAPGIPLARAARRLTGVVAVRESWRVTPAGTAPGPVPHRVVLVETAGPDDCDHVVHHLAHAARALDDTSVEVFAVGAGLPAYHRDALAVARPLVADDAAAPAPAAPVRLSPSVPARTVPPAPTPAERIGAADDEETWQTVADAGTSRTGRSSVPVPPPPDDLEDLEDLEDPVEDDADEPELLDVDEPELADADEPEPAVPDETDEAPAARDVAPQPAPAARPARPAAQDGVPRPAAPPETSIDEDLSSTARRIAALWARPSPEDFSAPLPGDSLEPTRLEPADDGPAHEEGAPDAVEPEDDDEAPSGRHGRPAARTWGRRRSARRGAGRAPTVIPSPGPRSPPPGDEDASATDPAPRPPPATTPRTPTAPSSRAPGSVGPARGTRPHSPTAGPRASATTPASAPGPDRPGRAARSRGRPVRGRTRCSPRPSRSARNRSASGPTATATTSSPTRTTNPTPWGPTVTVTTPGSPPPTRSPTPAPSPGPRLRVRGPWRPRPDPARSGRHRPPAPPSCPHRLPGPPAPGYPASGRHPGGPGPRRPGDPGDAIAPVGGRRSRAWTPEGHPRYGSPAQGPDPSWTPDDDSVAQLSDRERDLLARLHEELAQRERSEGADPFGAPPSGARPLTPAPAASGGARRTGQRPRSAARGPGRRERLIPPRPRTRP